MLNRLRARLATASAFAFFILATAPISTICDRSFGRNGVCSGACSGRALGHWDSGWMRLGAGSRPRLAAGHARHFELIEEQAIG